MKNELPVYFSFQISCVIIHLLTTKSLFAHGEHIFDGGDYIFGVGEYIISMGKQNRIHLFFQFFYRKAFFCINQASKNGSKTRIRFLASIPLVIKLLQAKIDNLTPSKLENSEAT